MKPHICYGINISHISEEGIERLVKDEILEHLIFNDGSICINCVIKNFTKLIKMQTAVISSRNHSLRCLWSFLCSSFIPTFLWMIFHVWIYYLSQERSSVLGIHNILMKANNNI